MASTDALPVPRKNVAYRLTFPIFKSDGTLITAAAGLDSEVSKDAAAFADCTNEATEIATSSGVYYLDLTSTEMNADCVSVLVKSSSTGAVPQVIVLYPQESGDIRVDADSLGGSSLSTLTGAYPALGIIDSGTAQSATGTTVVLRSAAAFADDTVIGSTLMVYGSTQGYWQSRVVTDYVLSTDTATVDTWTVTPSGTITYVLLATAPASSTAFPSVVLANAAHGGAAASLTLQKVVVSNSTAGESAVAITASGTGNAHGLAVTASGGGKGVAIGAASVGMSIDSSTADAVQIGGGTNSDGLQITGNGTGVDIRANITGNLTGNVSGSVGSVTAEVLADIQKINGTTIVGDGAAPKFGV